MLTERENRRRAVRWAPEPTQPVSRVRLRAGRELAVIDVSSLGALLEGPTRLLPGTHVDVHVTATQGRLLVRARVVRCAVSTLSADIVQYRGALAFESAIDLQPMPADRPVPDAAISRDDGESVAAIAQARGIAAAALETGPSGSA